MVQKEHGIHPELEEQRCLVERQQVQIQRLQRQLQLQAQLTTVIQSELDALRVALQATPPGEISPSKQQQYPADREFFQARVTVDENQNRHPFFLELEESVANAIMIFPSTTLTG